MTFFNRKEDVIDIQLTQYGKYVLSKGRFKPVCYAFFDDDIIYDVAYGSEPNELAQDTHNRISSVPRLKTIHNVEGIEEKVKRLNEINTKKALDSYGNRIPDYFKSSGLNIKTPLDDIYGLDEIDKLSMTVDSRRILKSPIGTSELGNEDYPAWRVQTLTDTKINEPFILLSEAGGFETQTIPLKLSRSLDQPHVRNYQLEMTPRMIVMNHLSDEQNDPELDFQTGFEDTIEGLPDDRKITFLQKPDIILDVQELNVALGEENFEVEVFHIVDRPEKTKGTKGIYIKDELELEKIPIENRVETYFEINFDENIIMPNNYESDSLLDRAILEDRLDEYYNNSKTSRVTLFENGIDVTDQKKSTSVFNRENAGDNLNARNILDRNKIGESLYDFDREFDEEDCE